MQQGRDHNHTPTLIFGSLELSIVSQLTDFLATEIQSDRKQNILFIPFKAHHFSSESHPLCVEGVLSHAVKPSLFTPAHAVEHV